MEANVEATASVQGSPLEHGAEVVTTDSPSQEKPQNDRDQDVQPPVTFDNPGNPMNPRIWSRRYKWTLVFLLSAITFIV